MDKEQSEKMDDIKNDIHSIKETVEKSSKICSCKCFLLWCIILTIIGGTLIGFHLCAFFNANDGKNSIIVASLLAVLIVCVTIIIHKIISVFVKGKKDCAKKSNDNVKNFV